MTFTVAFVKRLTGLNGGACFDLFRISTLSLVVAPAEYCYPVWNQLPHANKRNTPFNEALYTISGCIKPTCVSFLPFLADIKSLENRCHSACEKLPEVESSRTHFEVLGLEACSPRKLPCPRLEDSTVFEQLKLC